MSTYCPRMAWSDRLSPDLRAVVSRDAAAHPSQAVAAMLDRKRHAFARRRATGRSRLMGWEQAP